MQPSVGKVILAIAEVRRTPLKAGWAPWPGRSNERLKLQPTRSKRKKTKELGKGQQKRDKGKVQEDNGNCKPGWEEKIIEEQRAQSSRSRVSRLGQVWWAQDWSCAHRAAKRTRDIGDSVGERRSRGSSTYAALVPTRGSAGLATGSRRRQCALCLGGVACGRAGPGGGHLLLLWRKDSRASAFRLGLSRLEISPRLPSLSFPCGPITAFTPFSPWGIAPWRLPAPPPTLPGQPAWKLEEPFPGLHASGSQPGRL